LEGRSKNKKEKTEQLWVNHGRSGKKRSKEGCDKGLAKIELKPSGKGTLKKGGKRKWSMHEKRMGQRSSGNKMRVSGEKMA